MAPSKQLRDMVLDIVKKNKDIGFDDIIIQMKKMVGIRGDSLIKLVDEILKWWEEGGKIVQMVDKRTKTGMYRMNENTKTAKDIIDEALSELGIDVAPQSLFNESIRGIQSIKPNSPNWYTGELLSNKNVEGASRTHRFRKGDNISIHPFDGDRFVGAVDKNDPGTYFFVAKYSVKPIREETIYESYYDTMKFMSRMAKSGWTADSVSKTADIGSDKGYGVLIKNTKTPYKHMIMTRTSGKKIKVSFDFGKDEFVGTAQEVADHVNKILGIK